ncbi:hypothetical protein [Nonomuraea sp. NPDC049141]|uniref:hypothetical protein n=1 Tax=unclassified Nonomuraea TaxID=2593643 RepID=UPI0033DAB120
MDELIEHWTALPSSMWLSLTVPGHQVARPLKSRATAQTVAVSKIVVNADWDIVGPS